MSEQPDDLPDLNGKIVWVELAASSDPNGVLLEYPEFRREGGRLFLRGRLPGFVSGWLEGVEAAVAWDAVIHYMVFRSAEDYKARAATYKDKPGSTLFKRR